MVNTLFIYSPLDKNNGPPVFTKSYCNLLTSVVDRNWFHKFRDKGPSGEIYGHGIKAEKS